MTSQDEVLELSGLFGVEQAAEVARIGLDAWMLVFVWHRQCLCLACLCLFGDQLQMLAMLCFDPGFILLTVILAWRATLFDLCFRVSACITSLSLTHFACC
jgi:hypothetical protein